MAERPDYYAALGVDRDAEPLQIKQAYRRLANAHHPDRHPNDQEATRRFQSLVEAYRVLGDAEHRGAYDQGLSVDEVRVESGTPLEELVGGVIDQLFGIRERGSTRGRDRLYNLTLTLSESCLGCRRELSLPSDGPCQACDGRGFSLSHLPEICSRCGGAGLLQRRHLLRSHIEDCPDCEARGFLVDEACETCSGSGCDGGSRSVAVDIPPGVATGARLKIRDAGEPGRSDGPYGDCIIVLTIQDHPLLRRRGRDICTERPITLFFALLGGSVVVPSLEGKAHLQVPPGVSDGTLLKMVGLGVLGPDGLRGDQLVTLRIEIPEGLAPEHLPTLESLAETVGLAAFPSTRAYEASLSPSPDPTGEGT